MGITGHGVNGSQTVNIAPHKHAVNKRFPKGIGVHLSICAALFLLLFAICLPRPSHAGGCDSIQMGLGNYSPDLAIQGRPAGAISFGMARRSTGTFPHNTHTATLLSTDLPVGLCLPRILDLRQARFPTSKFENSTVEVRAPPVSLQAKRST
jgi:hypothetical protein